MLAIAANALYTTLYRRGTTRQLANAIVVCVICALLLLPAIVWYTMRFNTEQAAISLAEVQVVLVYVVLCGWFLPLSITTSYYLFTPPRLSTQSAEIPRSQCRTRLNPTNALQPPRQKSEIPAPFVFNEEAPWGWLEYKGGRFQGQRLALKRTIITFGREEENDIWLDDEMASRYHAELSWNNGIVHLTDCDSLNGVLLNGKRIAGTSEIKPEDILEVGSHRFMFLLAAKPEPAALETFDPLNNHTWRSSLDSFTASSKVLPATRRLLQDQAANEKIPTTSFGNAVEAVSVTNEWQDTTPLASVTPLPVLPEQYGTLVVQNGDLIGKTVLLDRPVITIGRDTECNIMMNDASISRKHAQFSRYASGDYVQDLTSRNGTLVNDEPLLKPYLLRTGDHIRLGIITLEYTAPQHVCMTPLPSIVTPQSFVYSMSGPILLKLPSKQKENT